MIEFFTNLMAESPLLFVVFIINAALISYVGIYVAFYVFRKKQPGKLMYNLFWKVRSIKKPGGTETIDGVYTLIMESLRREGVLSREDKAGLLARNKALAGTKGKKHLALRRLFDAYEARVYAGREVRNEAETAGSILSDYLGSG